ncbi:MAG: adenylate/guanylate cyclase domain-containing protein [Candidatus Wallbacteria bacterium]|nr:adenylate/guanylate cyclase domain-containing protein [Candidatus Wallbacteria bacterium]
MSRKKFLFSFQFSISSAFISVVLFTACLLGVSTYFMVSSFIREQIRERLHDSVSIAAQQIDTEKHRTLLTRSDEISAAYQEIKESLRKVKANCKDFKYIYTMRRSSGDVYFVVDAEDDPTKVSHIGDLYDEPTEPMLAAFNPPYETQVEKEFNTDKWGTFLSSYAPLFDKEGKFEGILGIDISADKIIRYERLQVSMQFFISLLVLVLVIVIAIELSRKISQPLLAISRDMQKVQKFEIEDEIQINSRIMEMNHMKDAIENMKKGLRSFKKYVPAEIVSELISLKKEAVLSAERRELSIFFSDIESFSRIAEKYAPEKLAEDLDLYFRVMTSIILENHGTLDKYIGDAIMAFWGAPRQIENHAVLACLTALKCCRDLSLHEKEWMEKGLPLFKTRFGINTGPVVVGNIGYSERLNYTILGDNVNLANRLEGLNKYYGTQIMISEFTYQRSKTEVEARLLDIVAVKGKSQGIGVYELVSERGSLSSEFKRFIDLFNEGMEIYMAQKWAEARKLFEELKKSKPDDKPAQIILARCVQYEADPPHDWTGVTHMHEK